MKRYGLWMALLLVAAAIGTWQLRQKAPAVQQVSCAEPVKGCSFSGVELQFDHVPQPMLAFRLSLQASGVKAAHADFAMQGMSMGLNRYRLLPQTDGRWVADVMLPVCIRGRSDWLLELELQDGAGGERRYRLAFRSG